MQDVRLYLNGFIQPSENPKIISDEKTLARVTAVHRERYEIICENGETFARLKGGLFFGKDTLYPTVGDFVTIVYNELGDSLITETLPRKTFFSRADPDPVKPAQAVAANFDYVFILSSQNRNFNLARLERYLTLAYHSGAIPVIILTKADLCDNPEEHIEAVSEIAFGVPVHSVSAVTGEGMDALDEYLKPGKMIVFLGSSGVGKSSLINALAGEELMETGEIREDDDRGRHTTTHRQLMLLKSGVMVIDTPGMRTMGMSDATDGLSGSFSDVEAFLGKCRFTDCKHHSEPGCAIREAIRSGKLTQERWESFERLKRETGYGERKARLTANRYQKDAEREKLDRLKSKDKSRGDDDRWI